MEQNRNGQEEVRALDKHGKTITIKINGKDRPIKEDKLIHKQEDAGIKVNPLDKDEVESWVFPNDRDEAIYETAASQEQVEESFDWILPDPVEEEVVNEYKIAPKQAKKQQKKGLGISVWNTKSKRNNRLYTTIFITVFFAVLLGTAFGVTILKFVTAESETAAPVTAPAKNPPSADKPAAGSESVKLAAIPAFVIQNGIFTTVEAAKERVNLLAGQGVTGEIFPGNGKFAVFLGMAGSIEKAKQEAERLKSKGVEVFAKPIEISGGTAADLTAEESGFLQQAPEVYKILTSGAEPGAEAIKKVEEYQATLSKIADKSIKDKNVLKAKASIERASGAYVGYQKSKDANQLAEMEAGLLSFLAAYQSISAISVN
jgi:stage II sporulation protein B